MFTMHQYDSAFLHDRQRDLLEQAGRHKMRRQATGERRHRRRLADRPAR